MENKASLRTINILSVLVPVLVMLLLGIRNKPDFGSWTKILPHIIAILNTITSVLLILGYYFIKKQKIAKHRIVMTLAFSLGAIFLVCYILYHISNDSTSFGGLGLLKGFYYFILISHVLLSMLVLPLVLRAYYFALKKDFIRHKKLVKFAHPIWLYVSISGVITYLLISPYYV